MQMRQKIFAVLLVTAVSFFFLSSSAYSNFNSLIEADFLTRGLKFEAADNDDLLVDKQTHVDFALGLFSIVGCLGAGLFEKPSPSSFEVPGMDLPFSILRC
jgi:hypothetical protein